MFENINAEKLMFTEAYYLLNKIRNLQDCDEYEEKILNNVLFYKEDGKIDFQIYHKLERAFEYIKNEVKLNAYYEKALEREI